MHTEKIDFRRIRDFGEIINATFRFIRLNFRNLFFTVLYIGGPFALLSGLTLTLFQNQSAKAMRGEFTGDYFSAIGVYTFVVSLAYIVIVATVYHFVLLTEERGEVEVGEVWRAVRKDFLMLFVTNIGYLVITMFATLCFFIPGIYTGVALIPIFMVRLVERVGFFDAVSRSFKLVSGRWWRTFGVLFILAVVQSILSALAVLPVQILGFVFGWLSPTSVFTGLDTSPLGIAVDAVKIVVSVLGSALIIVGLAFHYFSLVEEKEGRGLMNKIRTMGTQPDTTRPEEEEEY